MADALILLEEVLISQKVKLTAQEARVIATCKAKVVRDFTFSTLLGGGLAWVATWKLNRLARVNLSAGFAVTFGLWRSNRHIGSSLDYILAADGTRMQVELAKILTTKYWNDPLTMQRINRHFYLERLFTDANSEKVSLRFRYRNFFSDDGTLHQKTDWNDSTPSSHEEPVGKTSDMFNSKKADVGSPQVLMHPGVDVMEDPLDSIFGQPAPVEEIHQLKSSSPPTRVQTRRHRRSHRKHRIHRDEDSSRLDNEQL